MNVQYRNCAVVLRVVIGVARTYRVATSHACQGVQRLELLVVTHLDRDHIGGIEQVIRQRDGAPHIPREPLQVRSVEQAEALGRVLMEQSLSWNAAFAGKPVRLPSNHFKSQSGKNNADRLQSAAKRKDQAGTVAKILGDYDLTKAYVVVLGDLNEDTDNAFKSLSPLYGVADLHPVFDPNLPAEQRHTYHFAGGKKGQRLNQLDYIFLSTPLHNATTGYGFERRGIFEIDKIAAKEGAAVETPFPEVDSWDVGASDHAGLWVDIDL